MTRKKGVISSFQFCLYFFAFAGSLSFLMLLVLLNSLILTGVDHMGVLEFS